MTQAYGYTRREWDAMDTAQRRCFSYCDSCRRYINNRSLNTHRIACRKQMRKQTEGTK